MCGSPPRSPRREVNRLLYVGPLVLGLFVARSGERGERHVVGEVTFYPPLDGGRYRRGA